MLSRPTGQRELAHYLHGPARWAWCTEAHQRTIKRSRHQRPTARNSRFCPLQHAALLSVITPFKYSILYFLRMRYRWPLLNVTQEFGALQQ